MTKFKFKNDAIHNISLIALLCAIDVVFVLFIRFVPGSFIYLLLFFPSISVVEALFCDLKYYPFYFIVAAGLCFLTNISDISNTLFYIIPSLVLGLAVGICIKYKISLQNTMILCSLVSLSTTYITLPIIKAIYEIDVLNILITSFGLSKFNYIFEIGPSFVFFLSFVQVTISVLITIIIAKSLQISIILDKDFNIISLVIAILLDILSIIFIFTPALRMLPILLFCISLTLIIFEIAKFKNINALTIGIIGGSFVLSIMFFLIFSPQIIKPFQILIFETMIFVVALYIMLLITKRDKGTAK